MLKKLVLLVTTTALLTAGLYYKDDLRSSFDELTRNVKDFQHTDLGSTIAKLTKEFSAPDPLKVFNGNQGATLVQAEIIAETNAQRENQGLLSLKENTKLDAAAMTKARDMFAKQYFEHISPSGVDPGKLVQDAGYEYVVAGENLILGNFASEKEVVEAWMNSPGHRANILNARYTEIGVAILKGMYEGHSVWIGVQEFGLPLSACEQPNADMQAQIDANKRELDIESQQITQKKQEIDNTSSRSPGYRQKVEEYNQLVEQYNNLVAATKRIISLYNAQVNTFNDCVAGK